MFETLAGALEDTPLAVAISQGSWQFPAIESIHVLALAVVFGSISMVDLRLLNITLRGRDINELTKEVLPWTWVAFVTAAITGGLMFISAATKYLHFWPFKLKMVLIAAAGVNMMVFHLIGQRSLTRSGADKAPPLSARISGGISLTLWVAIIICGRVIGFL